MRVLRRPISVVVTIATLCASFMIGVPVVLAESPVLPMPGEHFLTAAERRLAVSAMHPAEREELGPLFADGAPGLVVAYTRRQFNVIQEEDGSTTVLPVGEIPGTSISFSIPALGTAGTGGKPGTSLYISVTVVRTRSTPPHEWRIQSYADWDYPNYPTGMDPWNPTEESIGVAWAGGLYIYEDTDGGLYWPCYDGFRDGLNIYRSDAAPNVGIGWSWQEWNHQNPTCISHGRAPMQYVRTNVYIRENSWKNKTSNVTMKYFHTSGGGPFQLSFGAGPVSVNISPTSDQWSAAAYTSFNH